VSPHQELLAAGELLDGPNDAVLLGSILNSAHSALELWRVSILWDRNKDLDIVGQGALLELGLGLDHVLDSGAVGLHHGLHPDEGLHLGVQAIRHELEVTVRGDKRDGAVGVKAREAHALVELDVLHLHCLALAGPAGGLEEELVIEAKTELGHASQVDPHLDNSKNFTAKDGSIGICLNSKRGVGIGEKLVFGKGLHEEVANQHVHGLDHIQEHLVLPVLQTLRPP